MPPSVNPDSTTPQIVVVGSTNTDLVVDVPHVPAPGETVLGGALQNVAGGKGANQAVACARLGAQVTFVARIGDDAFGNNALASFRAENISTDHVSVTPGIASGVALIAVSENTGENSIVVSPGANAYLSREDVEAAATAFDTANAVITSLEVPLDAVLKAAQMAHERSIPFILNPAPARTLPPELLALTTIFTPNESEAVLLSKANEETMPDVMVALLLETGVKAVVMTLGSAGALIATPDGIEQVHTLAVQAVDTVAAGDCFTGALAVEFARGQSLRASVQFANAAAALSVTRRGAQPSLPTRNEVELFRAKSKER